MTNVAISVEWYNEIKNRVKTENPWFYKNDYGFRTFMVEVDVEEEEFNKVSTELGWM